MTPRRPAMERPRGSPYVAWAKSRATVRWNLAVSSVRTCPPELLDARPVDFEFHAENSGGWPPLLDALSARYGIPAHRVVPAHGASMANHLALAALLRPGDDVLVEAPAYDPLVLVPAFLGARVRRVARRPEDGWALQPESVEAALEPRTRAVILSDLHNPTGTGLGSERVRRLARLAEERDFHLVVDEVYLEILHSPERPSAALASDRVVATRSLTKAYGLDRLRAGWILAGPDVAAAVRRVLDLYAGSMAHPTERLALRALERIDRIAEDVRSLLSANRTTVESFLASRDDLSWTPPDGGSVGFLRLHRADEEDLVRLLETEYDATIAPGSMFGAPGYVRLGFGMRSEELEGGLERLGAALDRL